MVTFAISWLEELVGVKFDLWIGLGGLHLDVLWVVVLCFILVA